MIINEKLKINKEGSFILKRHKSSQEFVCDRCLLPKKAKLVINWEDNQNNIKTICNGCFGKLTSL